MLRRDPAAVLKSRVELGHFCGRHKQSDWLLLPPHHDLVYPTISICKHEGGGREPASEEVDMDGFEALIAYAAYTDASIRLVGYSYGDVFNFMALARRSDIPQGKHIKGEGARWS